MSRLSIQGSLVAAAIIFSSTANAGVYTDDLSRCLVSSTTKEDIATLSRWIFAIYSTNPVVSNLASISTQQRDDLNRQGAALMQRLMLVDCRKQTVDALKYEGSGVIESSFNVLGSVAGRGLMNNPETTAEVKKFTNYIDKDKFRALGKEAGIDDEKSGSSDPKK